MRRAGPTRCFLRWFVLNRTIHSPAAFFPTRIRILTPRHHLTLITCALTIKIHKCATAGLSAYALCGRREIQKTNNEKYISKATQIRMLLFNLNMKNLFMLFVVSVSPSVSELSKKCVNVCRDKIRQNNA